MDRDLTCAEQTTRLPALPGWSMIGPPEMSCFQMHIMFPHLHRHLVLPQVCGADSRQVCWWHKMWEGENVTFFEGKETQVQELIFRSKIGRNHLAHGFTFLSKVPLEVCGQGCVTEEAPEEWSSFNSSHAFVPLCLCAFVPWTLIIRISSIFFCSGQKDNRHNQNIINLNCAMFFVTFTHIMYVSEENDLDVKLVLFSFLPFDPSAEYDEHKVSREDNR